MVATTARKVTHKERLLGSGVRMFYAYGYHGTTVDSLLADANAPKGSFYHHFGSKEAFGFAVLDRYDAYQQEVLSRWAPRDDLGVPERLAGYHGDLVSQFVNAESPRPCLVGKLSNELAVNSETYRERLCNTFTAWKAAIADLLAEGQQRGEIRTDETADRLADAVLAMIQGSFVAALARRENDYLSTSTRALVDLVVADR